MVYARDNSAPITFLCLIALTFTAVLAQPQDGNNKHEVQTVNGFIIPEPAPFMDIPHMPMGGGRPRMVDEPQVVRVTPVIPDVVITPVQPVEVAPMPAEAARADKSEESDSLSSLQADPSTAHDRIKTIVRREQMHQRTQLFAILCVVVASVLGVAVMAGISFCPRRGAAQGANYQDRKLAESEQDARYLSKTSLNQVAGSTPLCTLPTNDLDTAKSMNEVVSTRTKADPPTKVISEHSNEGTAQIKVNDSTIVDEIIIDDSK